MPHSHAPFLTTHWSAIVEAQGEPSPQAQTAIARLCEVYWYPIYAFLRRKGHSPHDAEDLTQGFFALVLRRKWLDDVGPEKGRFRMFVLRCLANFVANQPRLPATVPIDFGDAEDRFAVEPAHNVTPDRLLELRWAAALIEQATARLQRAASANGSADRFAALLPYLTKETAPGPFAEVAVRLGLSAEAARQEVSRMRQRFRQAICEEIAETVSGSEEIEDELQHLMQVVSG